MMMGGPFRLAPNPATWMLINWYVTSLFSCVMFLPVPFIFRYFTVCRYVRFSSNARRFRQKILNFWEFLGLVLSCLLIAIAYGCLHGYTFYPRGNITKYEYIINAEFWKDPEGRLPVYVVSDIVGVRKEEGVEI